MILEHRFDCIIIEVETLHKIEKYVNAIPVAVEMELYQVQFILFMYLSTLVIVCT